MEEEAFNLGSYRFSINTTSQNCQTWFNRGYLWAQGFNHEEAVRCFMKAIECDEKCAMAYWGVCYAKGPNYNKTWTRFDELDRTETVEFIIPLLQKAQELAMTASPLEAALIQALKFRFSPYDQFPRDTSTLDHAYAREMCHVYERFSSNLDISALCAEALMCISPRALWSLSTGRPAGPQTTKARQIIEHAMELLGGYEHPAICHLYIHLMEMSPYPETALPAADRLRSLMPDASHMQHMPTHIDIACGDYRKAIEYNQRAILADDKYFSLKQGSVLYVMYRAHNIYVKLYSSLISGRSQEAFSSAARLSDILTPSFLGIESPPMADWTESYLGAIVHVMVRFGKWDDLINKHFLPSNEILYCSTTAMVHYGRGIALAVRNRLEEAKREQARFENARVRVPNTRLNSLPVAETDVLEVASAMLQGEIQYRQGQYEEAFRSLREAVMLEDKLPYADPPPWMQPARHALGALLLEQHHFKEAEVVYRDDLGIGLNLPRRQARLNNVWGLHGLYECLLLAGKEDEARIIKIQKDIAMASADVSISSSCFCRLSCGGITETGETAVN